MAARPTGAGARKAAHARAASSRAAGVSRAHALVYAGLRQLPGGQLPRPPKRAMPGCSPMQIKVMRVAGTPRAARRARISVTCSWSYRSARTAAPYSVHGRPLGLVPYGELAHHPGRPRSLVAGEIGGPDLAQLSRRDRGHRSLVQDVAPVDHAPRQPGPRHIGRVTVAYVQRPGHPVGGSALRHRARGPGEEPAAGGRVRLAGLGHPGAYAPLEVGLPSHDRLPRPVRESPAIAAAGARPTHHAPAGR